MTKTRSTKRALLMSGLALLMCVSMLIGSTFAWFTDSVTSAGNKIQSGTLKLDLELYDADNKTWNSIKESKAPIFNYDLWEPGYTEVQLLKVENEGNLALKWMAKFVCMEELTDLAKVIDVYVLPYGVLENADSVTLPADRNLTGYTKVGTVAEFVNTIETTTTGSLEAGEAAYLGIALKMQESAGNEYQGMDLGAAFDIQILATQYTSESDSFNNQYDEDAEYPVIPSPVKVSSTTTYAEIEDLFAQGKSIYVTEDMTIDGPVSEGATRMNVNGDVAFYFADDATLTFKNTTVFNGTGTITVKNGSLETAKELCISGNSTMVFEGGEHTFGAFSVTSNGKVIVNGGTLNCKGTYAGIMGITFGENGKLIVNDGKLNMYQPFNLNPNRCDAAYIEINGGTIDLLNGIENLFVVRNVMDKDKEDGGVLRGSSIRVNGGTFIAHYEIDSAGDATSFIRNGDGPSDTNKVLVSNAADKYDCVVIGGTFYGSWQRADNQRYTNGNGGYSDGLFVENSIAGFIANGYEITGDATNGYVVSAK